MAQVFMIVVAVLTFAFKSKTQDILFPGDASDTFPLAASGASDSITLKSATGADSNVDNVPVVEGLEDIAVLDVKAILPQNSHCKDAAGVPGFCVTLGSCPLLLSIATFFTTSSLEYKLLQQSFCGNVNKNQMFCCRSPTNQASAIAVTTRPPPVPASVTTSSKRVAATTPDTKGKKKCETAAELNSNFCGTSSKIIDRIIGGVEAQKGAWPWAALLFLRKEPERPFCGASLITNNHVITAAHCLLQIETDESLAVRLAEHDVSTTRDGKHININVNKISRHPQYNSFNQENDIAVLHLERGVCFTDRVRPICVPDSSWSTRSLVGGSATAVGWGINDLKALTQSTVLQQVGLEVFSPDTCRRAYAKVANAPKKYENILCAGDNRGGKDACQGDSGGPLMQFDEDGQSFVVGVVSAGVGCGRKEFPGLFTKVSEYHRWILEVTSPDAS